MIIIGGGLVITLILQFRARQYVTWIYWLNIALISVFGTMVADGIHLEPVASTPLFGILLAIIALVAYMGFTHMDIEDKSTVHI